MAWLSSLLTPILQTLLQSLIGWLQSWVSQRDEQAVGAGQQSARELAAASQASAAVAQAEVAAPKDQSQLDARLDEGSF